MTKENDKPEASDAVAGRAEFALLYVFIDLRNHDEH